MQEAQYPIVKTGSSPTDRIGSDTWYLQHAWKMHLSPNVETIHNAILV